MPECRQFLAGPPSATGARPALPGGCPRGRWSGSNRTAPGRRRAVIRRLRGRQPWTTVSWSQDPRTGKKW